MTDPAELTDEQLKSHRDNVHRRAFLIMLEVAVILAVPAAIVVFLRKTLEISLPLTYTLLAVALIVSWVGIIKRMKVMGARMREIDAEMKARDLFPKPAYEDDPDEQSDF